MSLRDHWIEWHLRRKWWFTKKEMRIWGITAQSPEKVHEYLSINAYKALRLYIEDVPWHPIVDNKWISKHYFAAHNIAMPETYGLLHPLYGVTSHHTPLQTAAHLFDWIDELHLDSFVLKHIGELKGAEVYVIESVLRDAAGRAQELHLIDSSVLKPADIATLIEQRRQNVSGYLLEERLPPHPEIATLTAGGLASLRINTLCCRDVNKVQLAFIRLGRSGATTDHGIRGGLYGAIDIESGRVAQVGRFDESDVFHLCTHHPDSGATLSDLMVPDWQASVELALQAARCCTGIPCVGWDVVPSAAGPKLIEGNVSWSMTGLQGVCGGLLANGVAADWRDHLGADLPDGSWRWRRKHWNKCRRLNFWERCLTDVSECFRKRRE